MKTNSTFFIAKWGDLSFLGKGIYTLWLKTSQKDLGTQKLVIK